MEYTFIDESTVTK